MNISKSFLLLNAFEVVVHEVEEEEDDDDDDEEVLADKQDWSRKNVSHSKILSSSVWSRYSM